jgi:uncharacterized protein YndB with AHSA1/START domain
MAARNSAATEPKERELVITRVFDAPRDLVFKGWIEPERLGRWWGPRGFTMPSCKMEVRPGGAYRFQMRSPEGTDHWLQGVYREVVEPERLACTWAWLDADGTPVHETLLTVTFDEEGDKTKLTLHQAVFESVAARDAHQSGWTSALECLAEYLATV